MPSSGSTERIDEQAADQLERANEEYLDKFYAPSPSESSSRKSFASARRERAIAVLGLQAGGGKIAAAGDPPPVVEGADMSLRIHESMINNLAFDALAGRTVYEEKVQAAAIDTLGHLPEKMKGDEDGKPWAITFAARQPISVSFADDGFKITIRGVKYYKGDEAPPGHERVGGLQDREDAQGLQSRPAGRHRGVPARLRARHADSTHRGRSSASC